MREDAAVEVGVELVFDELRQAGIAGMPDFGGKGLVVLAHQPVERRLFGTAALVTWRVGSGFAQAGCAHEGM